MSMVELIRNWILSGCRWSRGSGVSWLFLEVEVWSENRGKILDWWSEHGSDGGGSVNAVTIVLTGRYIWSRWWLWLIECNRSLGNVRGVVVEVVVGGIATLMIGDSMKMLFQVLMVVPVLGLNAYSRFRIGIEVLMVKGWWEGDSWYDEAIVVDLWWSEPPCYVWCICFLVKPL